MTVETALKRLAIVECGDHPCPPEHLRDLFAGLDCDVVVRDVANLADCDAAVTVYHHEQFLGSVEWVHRNWIV